jgi:HK97 family phage portal protein
VSLFRRQQRAIGEFPGATAQDLVPARIPVSRIGTVNVSHDSALRHSAVWACARLRANLVSTLPIDVFRNIDGEAEPIEVTPKPPILINPGGDRVNYHEWMFATQFDLDRAGNTFGLITERDRYDYPARIELVPVSACSVIIRNGRVTGYRIAGTRYGIDEVWHEKQYTVAGLHVGLSPIAYAAWAIGEYLSIGEFAANWFGKGGIPKALLRNTEKTIDTTQADVMKAKWMEQITNGDVGVVGKDWEYDMVQAEQTGSDWLEAKRFSIGDIARFMDVPGDLIDAAVSGSNITYANVVQRNLQFLIMSLEPTLCRREVGLSALLPAPRYVRISRNALLRMDPVTRGQFYKLLLDNRAMTPDEIRALEDRPPLTTEQTAQLDHFFPPKAPTPFGGGGSPSPAAAPA